MKRDDYLNLAREQKKKLWNLPIVIGALGIIFTGLLRKVKELEPRGRADYKRYHCCERPEY